VFENLLEITVLYVGHGRIPAVPSVFPDCVFIELDIVYDSSEYQPIIQIKFSSQQIVFILVERAELLNYPSFLIHEFQSLQASPKKQSLEL
jgi:hypothetical protein